MPLPSTLRLPLVRRFQTRLATIDTQTLPAIHRAWDGLDGYDEDQIATFTRRTAVPLGAAKGAAVAGAAAFYTTLIGTRPVGVNPLAVAAAPALRDPFISVWQALQSGRPWDDAVLAGRSRIEAVVTNLVQSSARQTGDVVAARTGVRITGYERVPNAGACAWCEEVAGATYASADSADFGHDRCQCSAVPIFD